MSNLTKILLDYEKKAKEKRSIFNDFVEDLMDEKLRLEQSKYATNPYAFFEKRIKTYDSAIEKFNRKTGRNPEDIMDIINNIHDIFGIRIITYYLDETYLVVDYLKKFKPENFRILDESFDNDEIKKDYIRKPKETGYASIHLACELRQANGEWFRIEVQIRTIMMHIWGRLDHLLRYKKEETISVSTKNILLYTAKLFKILDLLIMHIRDHENHDTSILDDLNIITEAIGEKIKD